jgi:hypothetical protein
VLTVGEYHKFLATLVRPELAALWPRAALSSPVARLTEAVTVTADRRQ